MDENGAIPEIAEVDNSFGVRSIAQMQNSTIQTINTQSEFPEVTTQNNSTSAPQVDIPQEVKTSKETVESSNEGDSTPSHRPSFADMPDFMNRDIASQDDPAIPKDLQLHEGDENKSVASTASTSQTKNSLAERRKLIKNRKRKKMIIRIIIIIAVAIFLFLSILFIYSYGKTVGTKENGPFSSEDVQSSEGDESTFDYSSIFTPQNSFRVGNAQLGYISIPNTWSQIAQPEGSTALQYTDNVSWVVTLMAVSTSQYSASDYANNVYHSIQSGGGQNITTGKATISGYPALTISAYYPSLDKYLTTWCFESPIGHTHYLAIEGPSSTGDNYNIIYSFKVEK